MSEGSLRGSRLGATSYENDDHVAPAERLIVSFDCPRGHVTTVPFSTQAEEIPVLWECRCGAEALQRSASRPDDKPARHVRTHWDMLMERRTIDDLEELLDERLDLLRQGRRQSA
ncbi:MAG: RNA polymerase-binding protein RbpA [Actinomycetales bacterium]|nr:RNA polymerase-binding protein RbpA [Actinomycetales bacterium]